MPGFFRNAGQTLGGVATRIGDAIAGVDRTGAHQAGQQQFYELEDASLQPDLTRAQTDAAMELANERREEAKIREQIRQARERVRQMENQDIVNLATSPYADLIVGELGSDYSSVMQGRNTGQEFDQRATVATPAGSMLGDELVTDDARVAAMEALSPASGVAARRPSSASEPLELVQTPEGAVYVPRSQAVGARPAPRPTASSTGPTSQARNIDDLVRRGVPEELAVKIVYNEIVDPRDAFRQIFTAARRTFANEEQARAEAERLIGELYGPEALREILEPMIPGEQRAGPELGDGLLDDDVVPVDDEATYLQLPSGTLFRAPDGSIRRKP
jgi:hypothetical protein